MSVQQDPRGPVGPSYRSPRRAAPLASIAALAALASAAQAAPVQLASTEPSQAFERPQLDDGCIRGLAQGAYQLPAGAAGLLTGALLDNSGRVAYRLEADLTTYLWIADPRQPRYGAVDGILMPELPSADILPVDLIVQGSWSQQPGEAARFSADIVEVNAVTGTVYGVVGTIQGDLQPGGSMALAAGVGPVRFDGQAVAARAQDAAPPENGALAGSIPPPPTGGDLPEQQGYDVHSGGASSALAQSAASGARRVRTGHQSGNELERELDVPFDDVRPDSREQSVPGQQSADQHGGAPGSSQAMSAASGARRIRAHHVAGSEVEREFGVPFDDEPPHHGPAYDLPGQYGYQQTSGVQGMTAQGGLGAHTGASAAGSEQELPQPESGSFFAAWGICD